MAVYPTNDLELVEKLGSLLNVDLDAVISLKNTDGEETAIILTCLDVRLVFKLFWTKDLVLSSILKVCCAENLCSGRNTFWAGSHV